MNYVVYCHTNVFSGKHYVGKTRMTMEQRWNAHVRDSRTKWTYFWKAIQRYGVSAWAHQVLAECSSNEEASRLEMYWIAELKSDNPRYGYNLTKGGEGCSANEETKRKLRGRIWSEESRAKLSQSHAGRQLAPEVRERISQSLTGKVMSDDVKQKISKALKGRRISEETRRRMSEGKRASWTRKKEKVDV